MHRQDRCHVRFATLLAEEAGGHTDRWDGVELAVARSRFADFNTAFVTAVPKDPQTIPKLVSRLRDADVPFTVQVPEPIVASVENQLRVARLGPPATVPGMRVELADLHPATTPGVSVRRISDALGRDAWIEVVASSVDLDRATITGVTPATLLLRPGLELWLGERDGLPVAAAATLTLNGVVGVYLVSVLEEHRGRGLGGTVTSAAILGASALHPAKRSVVQATAAGYGLYRRLGFQTVRPYRRFPSETAF